MSFVLIYNFQYKFLRQLLWLPKIGKLATMNRINIVNKIGKMLSSSREFANVSQDTMAKAMGVSKTTVQKWESGAIPIQLIRVFEWFDCLDVPPMPYIWSLIYESFDNIKPADNDKNIEDALIDSIKGMSNSSKRKLLYLIYGSHGSAFAAELELFVAYAQLSLREKLDIANVIRLDYHIAKERGELLDKNDIQPDMELLDKALQSAYQSVTNSKQSYSISGSE